MLRNPQHTLVTLTLCALAITANAQGITFKDAALPSPAAATPKAPSPAATPPATPARAAASAPKPAGKAVKTDVDLLCEGKLRVYSLLPDGSERESGAERSHDINLRVIDKKAFRSYDDEDSAIQLRFEDSKDCLARSDGSACFRQVDNPDGRRLSIKDHLDINRFNGRLVYTHLRSFAEPIKRGEETLAGIRLEYAAQCSRADAPRPEVPRAEAPRPAAPRTEEKPNAAPAVKAAPPADGRAPLIWVIKGPAPDAKAPAAGTKP